MITHELITDITVYHCILLLHLAQLLHDIFFEPHHFELTLSQGRYYGRKPLIAQYQHKDSFRFVGI